MKDGEVRAKFRALNERIGSLRQQHLELRVRVEQLEANKQRLESLKQELEDLVAFGACTDWDGGYNAACEDVLKKLEEKPHE